MKINFFASPKKTPYSQSVRAGNLIFVSGQVGIDKEPGNSNDFYAQCKRCFEKLKSALETAGSDMPHVVKVTVFLKQAGDMSVMNEMFTEYFPISPPARSTIVTELIAPEMLIEIDCFACTKD